MFERILAILFNKKLSPKTINLLRDLAEHHRSKVMVNALLDENLLEMMSQTNGQNIEKVRQNEKNLSWYKVYGIEETFKEAGLFVNVGVSEFTNEDDLLTLINQSKCDLLVVCEPGEHDLKKIEKLVQHIEIPIFLIPG
ncbi:hypothetical protein A2Y85_01275 [candidate division WOR-3 bacterium RBG_13_43_14]|uniref:UspA domain-containing protein n=1 Tax=candidate division WOR-3 bacterium RBG_13_43_14 TaxID=1802590 RepID=A0A1F4UDZ1_UNCW3|nr:MAG: hypothetical protein A2Y85_01275 [candidate division WOR-3 bacterium RBG_13_43_14]